ncbi:MAG: 16S rRNA (guanine(527)-N(7))-methyltransferase RsmG [Sphaerochaetaceae bacterium]|nr:16S rRNA (guanine(527)-N(7))-methyltransferase RsmG [Sphaerochaetaceae bacterium]
MTMLEEQLDLLHRGTEKIGIPLNSVQIEQFTQFLNILSLFNDTYKLVAASESEIVIKHILDSLAAAPILSTRIASRQWKNPRICDVGSGAGFPGIPLAIVMSDCRFTLLERSAKRCGFLRNACSVCNLSNRIEILEMDLHDVRDTFDVVTFRALHPLADIIRGIDGITRSDSFVAAYKGRYETIVEELDALERQLKNSNRLRWDSTLVTLHVPFLSAPRHLCLLEKRMI